jgi:predicted dinucleotide-binding enzyme
MKIAIIGTGNVGSALAKGWAKSGHQILLGVRDTNNFKGEALLSAENISVYSLAEAIRQAEVIVLSVPPEVIPSLAGNLKGAEEKVIIDPTNSFRSKPEGYANGFEALVDLTGCTHIAKAFNNTGANNMADPVYPQGAIDTFVAGDSEKAKSVVKQLANDLGFAHCYDFGGNDKAGLLEQLGLIWINLAMFQGFGREMAINVVKRAS